MVGHRSQPAARVGGRRPLTEKAAVVLTKRPTAGGAVPLEECWRSVGGGHVGAGPGAEED